jgi:uncharacterized protein (TIGR03435 family)
MFAGMQRGQPFVPYENPRRSNLARLFTVALGLMLALGGGSAVAEDLELNVLPEGFEDIVRPRMGELIFREWIRGQRLFRTYRNGETYILGSPLADHFGFAHHVLPNQVRFELEIDQAKRYDLLVQPRHRMPYGARVMLRKYLVERFNVTVTALSEEQEVLILTPSLRGVQLEPSEEKQSVWLVEPGHARAEWAPISRLVKLLRRGAELPIVNETGLYWRYDYELRWDPKSGSDGILESIGDLGIAVERGRRTLPYLLVRERSAAADAGTDDNAAAGAELPDAE